MAFTTRRRSEDPQPRDVGRRLPAGTGAALLSLAAVLAGSPWVVGATSIPTAECLGRTSTTLLTGSYTTQVRVASPPPDTTYDARTASFDSFPFQTLYPWTLGGTTPALRPCLVGGTVTGQQPRTLTWDEMKANHDGDALRLAASEWSLVDGLRVDNVNDGFAPRGTDNLFPKDGDGFELRNAYFTYVRDDCIENDDIAGGRITDSLLDGCYTGISEDPSSNSPQNSYPAPQDETLVLDHVLLRLEPMPGPRGTNDPTRLGHGRLFKWSSVANRLVVRDSVLMLEQTPHNGNADFPEGTTAENVTIVWLGGGAFPGRLPPTGVTVVGDRRFWDDARARWLDRHGCLSATSCSRLHDPDPYDPSPSPSPTPTPTDTPSSDPTPSPTPAPTETPSPEPTRTETPSPTPTPSTFSMTVPAAGDATIVAANPDSNLGTAKTIGIDGEPRKETLIKFDVSAIGARTITRVRLVLWCTDGSPAGGVFYRTAPEGWSETTATWNNAPQAEGSPVASLGAVTPGVAYEVDLTSLVTGDGVVSLRIVPASNNGAAYGARQNSNAGRRPFLLIDVVG